MADGMEELVWLVIGIMPDALLTAPANVLAVSLGIMVDKILLLRGQPNTITQRADLTDEQHLDRLRQIAERVRHRRLAGPDTGSSPDQGRDEPALTGTSGACEGELISPNPTSPLDPIPGSANSSV